MPLLLKPEIGEEDSRGFRGCGGPLYSFKLVWPTKPQTDDYVDSNMNMMKVPGLSDDLYTLSMTLRAVEWYTACISGGAELTVDDITYLAEQICTYLMLGQGIYTTSYVHESLRSLRSLWFSYFWEVKGTRIMMASDCKKYNTHQRIRVMLYVATFGNGNCRWWAIVICSFAL